MGIYSCDKKCWLCPNLEVLRSSGNLKSRILIPKRYVNSSIASVRYFHGPLPFFVFQAFLSLMMPGGCKRGRCLSQVGIEFALSLKAPTNIKRDIFKRCLWEEPFAPDHRIEAKIISRGVDFGSQNLPLLRGYHKRPFILGLRSRSLCILCG